MYKRTIINLVYVIILMNLFLPFVFAQPQQLPPGDQPMSDVIHKIMQTSQKDIIEDVNRNMDGNFQQLDERVLANNKIQFRKAIFALTGSLAVVIFGYAYVTNRISKRYDVMFFEKMIDSKLEKLSRLSYVVSEPGSYYTSVIKSHFEKRYTSPEKYFEGMSEQEHIKILETQVKDYKKELDNRGIKMEKETFYKSVLNEEVDVTKEPKPSKKKSFFTRFKKEEKPKEKTTEIKYKTNKKGVLAIIIFVIVVLLAVYYFVNKYTDFSFVDLLNITGIGGT